MVQKRYVFANFLSCSVPSSFLQNSLPSTVDATPLEAIGPVDYLTAPGTTVFNFDETSLDTVNWEVSKIIVVEIMIVEMPKRTTRQKRMKVRLRGVAYFYYYTFYISLFFFLF